MAVNSSSGVFTYFNVYVVPHETPETQPIRVTFGHSNISLSFYVYGSVHRKAILQ